MKKIKTLLLATIALVLGVSVSGAVKNTVRADEVVTLAGATSSFSMVNGAAVYVSENAEPRTGLKFKATLSNSDYASLNTLSGVTYGFIIMPADYVTEGYEITAANLFGDSAVYCFEAPTHSDACTKKHLAYTESPAITEGESSVSISASLVGIQQNNVPRTYIGVAYIKAGENVVLASYEDNKVENHARSMLYVAQLAVENNDENSAALITNYFAPFAGKSIPYTVKYELYGDNLGTETLIKSETLTQIATFSGTGLTKITAPDFSGVDSAFDGAVKDSDATEYVVYNENKTQITVKYTRSFNTALTSSTRQDLIVGPESSAKNSISLDGISEYFSVVSVEYNGVSLGNTLANLDLSDIGGVAHGEGDVKVIVADEFNLEHEITVPVTVITEVITDRDTLLHKVQYHKVKNGNDVGANLGAGEYYVLGSDIEVGDASKHVYGGTDYVATNNSSYGFAGTLDGRGYALTGVETSGWDGLFGGIQGGTVKNLGISIDSYKSSSLFGYDIKNAIVNNVVVVINEVIDNTDNVEVGFIAHNQANACTFTNFVVHAEGSSLKYLTSKGWHGIGSSTYTDCAIYAKKYIKGTRDHESAPAGLTFTSADAIKGQAVGTDSGATSYNFDLPQSFNGCTVTDITVNNVSLGASATDVSMSDIATAVGSVYGQYPAVITLKNKGVSFKLKTTFAYATKVITDWATLLHNVQYHTGNAGKNVGVGEYYVLGNDITGSGVYGHTMGGTYYTGTFDVGNATDGWKSTDNFYGFAGTLDGNGYTLKNVNLNSAGIFGSLYNATIKNLNINIEDWTSGAIFAYWMYGTTVENVNVTVKKATKDLTNSGNLADGQARSCTFKNFVLDAKGIALGKIASDGYYGGYTTTYVNSVIYAADYTSFGYDKILPPIEGLKFYKDRQTVELSGETVSVELPTAIKNSTYSCYRVRINGKDNMLIDGTVIADNTCAFGGTSYNAIDMTKLSVAKIKELIGENYGDYEIEFTIASNGLGYGYTGIYLPVTFVAPTAD